MVAYVVLSRPGHPLANKDGRVPRCRVVLWGKIGPGPHKCRWCRRKVTWQVGIPSAERGRDYLAADHVDRNPRNDEPANLVPSCIPCNTRRSRGGIANPVLAYIRSLPNRRSTIPKKYKRIRDPGHPLSNSRGDVLEHRRVLYAKIGGGAHRCHWCKKTVRWARRTARVGDLVADHLDNNRLNNSPDNLVPSCSACNMRRANPVPIREGELHVSNSHGIRSRVEKRTCETCGKAFLFTLQRKHQVKKYAGRFCSHPCYLASLSAATENRVCANCQKGFTFSLPMQRFTPGKFCSRRCSALYNNRHKLIGKHLPADALTIPRGQKHRTSAAEKTCENCGHTFLCAKHRLSHRRFCCHKCYLLKLKRDGRASVLLRSHPRSPA